jgi:hypothetical protein
LSLSVGDYLKTGSPDEDYIMEAMSFIKLWQAEIDMGEKFYNFQLHVKD